MNRITDRKKALWVIVCTLLVGITIGVLGTSILTHRHHRKHREHHAHQKSRLVNKILTVTKADSSQAALMKPLINRSFDKIDVYQKQTNRTVQLLIDSLLMDLKPIVGADQYESLQKFMNHLHRPKKHRY